MSTDPLDACHACPSASTVTTAMATVNENILALRIFLQGGIGPDGQYREGLKQEHDQLKRQVAEMVLAHANGKGKTWDMLKMGIGIIGGAIAGHYSSSSK